MCNIIIYDKFQHGISIIMIMMIHVLICNIMSIIIIIITYYYYYYFNYYY